METQPFPCTVYRSRRKRETYLFLPRDADPRDLPDELLALVGRLEAVMDLELTPERRLVRADARTVMAALREKGYYLQLPPPVI